MGLTDQIKDVQDEMARTQKNKATEHHLGMLKGKLARLRRQLLEEASKSGGKGEGFDVMRSGDARVGMIGFPSVGKSTLLSKVTATASESAAYEFTTLTCVPGKLYYKGAAIQLLDLPGIIEGAADGMGRGKQVIAVARTADCILMVLDAVQGTTQKRLLTKELEAVGIRLNKRPPDVYYKRKDGGGIKFTSMVPLTRFNERMARGILQQNRVHNAEIIVREDITVDEFIDAFEGNRVYMPCVYCYNKIDCTTITEVDRLAREPSSVVLSLAWDLNVPALLAKMWTALDMVRVYTKRRGEPPDFTEPLIVRRGSTVKNICQGIHRSLARHFKYALVWGTSAKHKPQRVGLNHVLEDEDVVQIVASGGK